MKLTELADEPQLLVTIDGEQYGFSELPIACKARLQAYIEQKVLHPLEAVKPHLVGLDPEDRRYLLNEARKEAEYWPPDISTKEGKIALLHCGGGQIEAFFIGLTVHHPAITREQAEQLYYTCERESQITILQSKREKREVSGESAVERIFACLFNYVLPSDVEGLPRLKANTSQSSTKWTGGLCTESANSA